MDYDRNDALLHWIFRQTQGDAWFKPTEETISSGVALRVNDEPEFRIFPYETPSLEPFETAVAALNPLVAVKVRSAAVHAALAEVSSDARSIHVDAETRIQILDTILLLPQADREQGAAFVRDERTLIIWSSNLDAIVPLCQDIEARLIKLLWRTRSHAATAAVAVAAAGPTPSAASSHSPNISASPSVDHSSAADHGTPSSVITFGRQPRHTGSIGNINGPAGLPYPFPPFLTERGGTPTSGFASLTGSASRPASLRMVNGVVKGPYGEQGRGYEDEDEQPLSPIVQSANEKETVGGNPNAAGVLQVDKDGRRYKKTWYGRKLYLPPLPSPQPGGGADPAHFFGTGDPLVDSEANKPKKRPVSLYAPIYNGLAVAIAVLFVGNGVRTLLVEWKLDDTLTTRGAGGSGSGRFALLFVVPLLWAVSLFFTLQIVQNITMMIGPIAHYHQNSKYYSALPPPPPPPHSHPTPTAAAAATTVTTVTTTPQEPLPHITIQMPVYKESLTAVLAPSIRSIKKAMQTYARQGGSSSIFICDDGLRMIPGTERDERLGFYKEEGIGWVARPREGAGKGKLNVDGEASQGFRRRGRFKKASNLNYGLELSLKMETHLESLLAQHKKETTRASTSTVSSSACGSSSAPASPVARPSRRFREDLGRDGAQYGLQYQNRHGDESVVWGVGNNIGGGGGGETTKGLPSTPPPPPPAIQQPQPQPQPQPLLLFDPEEKALSLAIAEMHEESGRLHRPWAANGRALRIGEIILLVDSDTVVPEDCLRDAAREMGLGQGRRRGGGMRQKTKKIVGEKGEEKAVVVAVVAEEGHEEEEEEEEEGQWEGDRVGIIQHECDVMQVAGHYFENGIAYFTRRINRCISISCANGDVAPFMGHNAFLRWKALQDAAFPDPEDGGKMKIWSENNVSEDFDIALRLMLKGYIIRWATYAKGGFKEGVSLSVDDEVNRWQKYSYGCNELLFNPLKQWWYKGPITKRIHTFLWSNVPLHYKISMLAYMFSYYGIAASVAISVVNYVLLGFQFPVNGYYMHSFEIFLATTVVFWGSGTLGYTLLEYRLGHKKLIDSLVENLIWIPFFFIFFGGLSIPVSQALLAHLFSYDISWSATVKEVERSNFFKEIPKILRRFWFPMLSSLLILAGVTLCSTNLVPLEWRIDGSGWAVIFPLSMAAVCHILVPIVLNPWLMVFSY